MLDRTFFPNDLRCGFRKLKERGVGNRPSGAVLVPKSLLLLLLLLLLLCPRSRPRPDFTYTKNLRYQNLHGRDLQGQSAITFCIFGPRVAVFSEPEPWAYKQLTHFSFFELFENFNSSFASVFGSPCRIFSEREPWAHKQSTHFAIFVISEYSSSSAVLLPLAPVSLFVQLFDAC